MQDLHLDKQPYIMNTGLVPSNESSLPCSALFPMHQIAKIRSNDVFGPEVRRAVQKRHDYKETFNLAQKIIQFAVEASSESLCRLKRSLNDWFAKEKRLTQIDNNKENLDLEQVENPIKR
ncbi:7255_t:CDS:1 [Dentiscutata heterogama]|uniref:7255_t:CDS:1 n=1 Tax=Dentiscutata heterogama TaxID=1316150 RepID=A0ACA9LWF1_9GLOM|nr:7255_t:CDS:1 [Dentiscutata heterogama]